MLDINKLAEEFPEVIIAEKKKLNGVNYRYIIQFINKPNVIMIDKSSTLYSGLVDDLTKLLNHGEYSDSKFKKLFSDIVDKLADEKTIINNASSFIKQGLDVLYKDNTILKPYNDDEIKAKLLAPTENEQLVQHLANSYTMITDLISYIRRNETKTSILNDVQTVNFDKNTINANIDYINEVNDKRTQEFEDAKKKAEEAFFKRMCLKYKPGTRELIRRGYAYQHHVALLTKHNLKNYIYTESAYFRILDSRGFQIKHNGIYHLKDVELIPEAEYQFDIGNYLDV